jgi:hypothetical protein
MPRLCDSVICLPLLWSLVSWSQSPPEHPSGAENKHQPEADRSTLLAYSELQKPRPLPIVKPLRFQEIPLTTEREQKPSASIEPYPAAPEPAQRSIEVIENKHSVDTR